MEANINNKKTAINFIWEINYAKWGTLEKIIDIHESIKQGVQKELRPEDIIPNHGSDANSWRGNKFFLQTIASWAAKYPENPVRLSFNFSNFFSMRSFIFKDLKKNTNIKDLEPRDLNIAESKLSTKNFYDIIISSSVIITKEFQNKIFQKDKIQENLIKYIQERYKTDITLEEIQNEYRETFEKLEKNIKMINNNFEIKEFDKLVKEYLSEDKTKENQILQEFLSDNIRRVDDKIDLFKLFINYYGFGYKKNLMIDMDVTPKVIKKFDEIENQKDEISFGQILGFDFENQLCSTIKKNIDFFKILFNDKRILCLDDYGSHGIFGLIRKNYYDYNGSKGKITLEQNRILGSNASWQPTSGDKKIINNILHLERNTKNYWPMDGYESTPINKEIHDQLKNQSFKLKDIEQFNNQKQTL